MRVKYNQDGLSAKYSTFNPSGVDALRQRLLSKSYGPYLSNKRPNEAFCESCNKYVVVKLKKGAKLKQCKGWKCSECRTRSNAVT